MWDPKVSSERREDTLYPGITLKLWLKTLKASLELGQLCRRVRLVVVSHDNVLIVGLSSVGSPCSKQLLHYLGALLYDFLR